MSCYECGGTGTRITCIDDMCRGAGECMHGDGEKLCEVCKGEPDDDLDDFDCCPKCLADTRDCTCDL